MAGVMLATASTELIIAVAKYRMGGNLACRFMKTVLSSMGCISWWL
jgi:hypothetical protein